MREPVAVVQQRDPRGRRGGALWCVLVYDAAMPEPKASLRRSVSLPSQVARRVEAIAKRERVSSSHVIVELIETGLETRDREKKEFFELADRLARSSDASEQARLKEELARRTFGE